MSQPVKTAVIIGAHGLKGAVRVRLLHPNAVETLAAWQDESGKPAAVRMIREDGPQTLLATLPGVSDRAAAEGMKGAAFYAPAAALPELKENEFYASQLIGLSAVNAAGDAVATVKSVENFGAGDILTLVFTEGREEMFPFTRAFFGEIRGQTILFHAPGEG